jgi:hypothetical protein
VSIFKSVRAAVGLIRHNIPESQIVRGAYPGARELSEVLPSLSAATRDFSDWIRETRRGASKEVGLDEPFAFGDPLSDEEKARLRYGRTFRIPQRFKRFGERWGRGLGLYWSLLPPLVQREVHSLFDTVSLWRFRSPAALAKALKGLSGVAKKHGKLLFPHWKYLVNLETLGGYLPQRQVSDFFEELKEWATGDVEHFSIDSGGSWSEDSFLADLEEGMWRFLSDGPSWADANDQAPTIREFADSPGLWASSGSTGVKEPVFYTSGGKRYKAKKTKWRTALVWDPSHVVDILKGKVHPQSVNKAIQKRESGKVRAVVNSDDYTYLRMAYVSAWLERALRKHPRSTLFFTKQQTLGMWNRMSEAVGRRRSVFIPLDQSHFDWQQNARMIRRFFVVLRKIIGVYASLRLKADLLDVVGQVERALLDLDPVLIVGDGKDRRTLRVTKGIMSGWRWTALMDTVFNAGELFAATSLIEKLGGKVRLLDWVAQGDDDQIEVADWGSAAALAEAYALMGFEVNPSKYFVANDRDEFLRQVAEDGLVAGYPARGVLSLLWRNPVSRDPPAGIGRMGETVRGWNVVLGRGCNKDAVMAHMVRDLIGGSGRSRNEVLRVLGTPASRGGLGVIEGPSGGLAFSDGQVVFNARVETSGVRGLRVEKEKLAEAGVDFLTDNDYQEWLSSVLDLSEAKREVIPAELTEVDDVKAWFGGYRGGLSNMPLRAPSSFRTSLGDVVLDAAIREKKWNWIQNTWVDVNWRVWSKRIMQRGGRRVWIDWLRGKLPFKLPVVLGTSELQVSEVFDRVVKLYWGSLVTLQRFNTSTILRAAVGAESRVRHEVEMLDIRLGG